MGDGVGGGGEERVHLVKLINDINETVVQLNALISAQ